MGHKSLRTVTPTHNCRTQECNFYQQSKQRHAHTTFNSSKYSRRVVRGRDRAKLIRLTFVRRESTRHLQRMSVHGSRQQTPCRCLCTKKQSIGAAAMVVSVKMNSPFYNQAAHRRGRSRQLSGAAITRHSFAIGRLTTPFLVRTETVRTQPFSSGNVCRMRPTNHRPLGAVL